MDDRLIGQLTATVNNLTKQVEGLQTRVDALNNTVNTGRGFLFGLLMAAGGLGAGLSQLLERIFK
ncbi:MAG: hypothetical protein AB7I42_25660 [Bradyrhizobium sp.]|uniref:hypothetical protein n=1 Tax=Bradyrhizobium sp. TaxID=376 RepID=UPI003D13D286